MMQIDVSDPTELPREFIEALLKGAGIKRGIAGLPQKLALYLEADDLPADGAALVEEMAKPEQPIRLVVSCGAVCIHYVVR